MESKLQNKIVAHFQDGKILKGVTGDFFPNKTYFHITDVDGKTDEVDVDRLKAIFFVKNLVGDKSRSDHYNIASAQSGRKIQVEFFDNEVIIGYTLGYSPERSGFFITPADPSGNNERAFIVRTATKNIAFL